MKKTNAILFCLVFLLAACRDRNIVYSDAQEVDPLGWPYDEDVQFTIPVKDTSEYYSLEFRVNHSPEFSFQNLYLQVETLTPNEDSHSDVISLELADRLGNWIGKCNSSSCATPFILKQNLRFTQIGDHIFDIAQHSREESLSGIQRIELLLRKSD